MNMNRSEDIFDTVASAQYRDAVRHFVIKSNVLRVFDKVYFLRKLDVGTIDDLVKMVWYFLDMCEIKFAPTKEEYIHLHNAMVRVVNRDLTRDQKFTNISVDEKRYKDLAIDFIISIATLSGRGAESGMYYIEPNWDEMLPKFEGAKKVEKFYPLFNYEEDEDVKYFHKVVKERMGIDLDKKTDDAPVPTSSLKSSTLNVSKKELGTDKRIKNRNILMIDVDTDEVIKTFSNREELLNEVGISKSNLSICITANKNPNKGSWRKWKNKDDGKRYYFVEKIT